MTTDGKDYEKDYYSLKNEMDCLKAKNQDLRCELDRCKNQNIKNNKLEEENEELRKCIRTMAKLL